MSDQARTNARVTTATYRNTQVRSMTGTYLMTKPRKILHIGDYAATRTQDSWLQRSQDICDVRGGEEECQSNYSNLQEYTGEKYDGNLLEDEAPKDTTYR